MNRGGTCRAGSSRLLKLRERRSNRFQGAIGWRLDALFSMPQGVYNLKEALRTRVIAIAVM